MRTGLGLTLLPWIILVWLLTGCATRTVIRDGRPETVLCDDTESSWPTWVFGWPVYPCRDAH